MVPSGPETEFLRDIVDTIYQNLDRKEVELPINLTGMDTRYREIETWLNGSNIQFLAICGMGGSGKTTLAKYIYDSNWKCFENMSFVENIGGRCKESDDFVKLQEQLLDDIMGGKKRKMPGVSHGTCKIKEALQSKRVLIVLDDLEEEHQLEDLLGNGTINAQSKIIITTRVLDIEKWFQSTPWGCHKYKMKLLNDDESLELLSCHAFGSKIPMEEFEELAVQALRYCEGNPLALEVLGSSLYVSEDTPKRKCIEFWESMLSLLRRDIDVGIQRVLSRSYESLPRESNKQLFLHIACFFVGQDIDYVVKILQPDYFALSGIRTLINKCLLSVSLNKKLMMHPLIQEMGRTIVIQESREDPAKRSRVWRNKDSYDVLRKRKGSETMEGLALDMKILKDEKHAMKKLESLQIVNLKDSHVLSEIHNLSNIPHLETLILWNCSSLVRVCETIGDLTSLTLLNMTGCVDLLVGQEASASGGVAEQPSFSFPRSLHRLFLKDCYRECIDSFPPSFSVQPSLKYLNLVNGVFDSLPCYNHLRKLRVLDLSSCSRLKCLVDLPNTLAELYVYFCKSLERITFDSPRFTLQEFGFEGCINLSEVEGFFKLVPVAKLEDYKLGHLKWLKEYQNQEVCLVGDDEITKGRSSFIQMLYEFDIMSTSLPDVKNPNMKPEYESKLSTLSFQVPLDPNNRELKGLDVTFKYTIPDDDDDWAWFCKISTTNGAYWMYNPKVFGKPESDKVGIWLSYWPIGNKLNTGDKVEVSIVVMSRLKVHECGVSLVYGDEKVAEDTLGNIKQWEEVLGGDLSGFELSTGAYYLCRRDFFELTEVGRLSRDTFKTLVGDTIDYTEIRGWRKTGRPKHMNPSFTELRTVRCIIHGPHSEEIYKTADMSKSTSVHEPLKVTSTVLGKTMASKVGYTYKSFKDLKSVSLEEISEIESLEGMDIEESTTSSTRMGIVKSRGMQTLIDKIAQEDTNISVTLGVADEHLGKLSEKIMEISQVTGAVIKISDMGDFIPGTSDRKITITGSQTAVNVAQDMIMHAIGLGSSPPPAATPESKKF